MEYSALAKPKMGKLRGNVLNKTSFSSAAGKQNMSNSLELELSTNLGLSSMEPGAWAELVEKLEKGEQEWEEFYRWEHL